MLLVMLGTLVLVGNLVLAVRTGDRFAVTGLAFFAFLIFAAATAVSGHYRRRGLVRAARWNLFSRVGMVASVVTMVVAVPKY